MKYEIQQSDDGYLLFAGERLIAETPTRRDAEKIQAALEFSDDNHPKPGAKPSKEGMLACDCKIRKWYYSQHTERWLRLMFQDQSTKCGYFFSPDCPNVVAVIAWNGPVYPLAEDEEPKQDKAPPDKPETCIVGDLKVGEKCEIPSLGGSWIRLGDADCNEVYISTEDGESELVLDSTICHRVEKDGE